MMIQIQSFFIFFLSIAFNTFASPALQRHALLEFKNEFPFSEPDPDELFDSFSSLWNTSTDHCSWEGVTCHAKSGDVISLVLEGIFLNSSLKANTSLLKLRHLHHLTIARCNLGGEIPSSLGNLSHLRSLDFSGNVYLAGEIPSSLGNLSHLIQLDLHGNHLGGKIPSSIENLSHLKHLSLGDNHLVGKIPSSLGNLSHLIELDLSSNNLIGEISSSISNLNQLTFMNIGSNNLSGNLPSSFAKLNKLSALYLSDNQFSCGDLPHILLNLTSLSELDISNNHFKSTLPSNMSGLRNLEIFDARGNSFVGNVPTSLFTIPSLGRVDLSGNQLQGPLEFGNTSSASELDVLDLAFNNFHGPIREYTSRFPELGFIDLSNNNFIGSIPGSMFKLVCLFYLDLSHNKLEGQVPSVFWGINNLALSHNSFSSFEKSPQAFVSETRPDLGSKSFDFLTSFLDVSNNHLTGSIPSCLMDFTASGGHINLRNNNLSGFLPDIFTNATKLRSLDVSGNQLVGKLPKSLINCKSMEYLNLRRNKLKDTFPSSLRSLGSLRVLLLGSNEFYGTISSHLGFPSLRVLDVSHNSFSGTLPQDYFVNWHEMSSMWRNKTEWGDYLGEGLFYSAKTYSYWDSMEMMYKGVDTEFPRILLAFKAIDFSGNKFTGRIPKSCQLFKKCIHRQYPFVLGKSNKSRGTRPLSQ